MDSLLHIGNEKEVVGAVVEGIKEIMRSGFENHVDQTTI